MRSFEVGPKVSDVEVYVHNRYQHFKRTADRMQVKGKIRSTVGKIKQNISKKVLSIQGGIKAQEIEYLNILGKQSKEEYYNEFSNYKNASEDKILDAMYAFTDLSPNNYAHLEEIIYRRFGKNINLQSGTGVRRRREDAFKMLYAEMQKENADFYKAATTYYKNLIKEYEIKNKKGTDQSTLEALKKRQKALEQSAADLKMKDVPRTVKGAQKQAAKLRSTDMGFGVSFEPVAGGIIKSLNNFINSELPQGKLEVVGDQDRKKNFTTDVTVKVVDMNIGIDVKSNKALYKKSTQKEGYGYEILSSIFLGKGGFSELGKTAPNGTVMKKFGNILSNPDPEFLKKITYLLVNSTVFQAEGVKIKAVNEAQQGLRTILIIGGLIDFIVTYIARATGESRQQILLVVGDQIIFTTDFVEHMVKMIESINPDNLKNIYGINYRILDEGAENKVPEGLKKKMLKEKLKLVRKGVDPYAKFLDDKNLRKTMQQITSAALQRSMQINLNIPLSELFKNRNS